MAYTQSQLDALDKAIATGTLTVENGDSKVTYRSLNEMLRIRATIVREISGGTRRRVARFSNGT